MTYFTSLERHAIGKGLRQGRRKGRQEGRQEGRAGLLLEMLNTRFGPLAPAVARRIAAAEVQQLSSWALNFIDAQSLDEVFHD